MQVHRHLNWVALFGIHENGDVGISDQSDFNPSVRIQWMWDRGEF